MDKMLITGANGFVGRALCDGLEVSKRLLVRAVRNFAATNQITMGNIGPDTDWRPALSGCDVVIHLAARVHVMQDKGANSLELFRAINAEGTINLARQASQAGVRRFVFLSSIKVNGEATDTDLLSEDSPVRPKDPYAISKWEAEQALWQISAQTDMEVVVLRPPLVYGPGVKANFYRMLKLVDKGIPLPLASVKNKRSMIYLGNLVDALIVCCEHPAAAGKTFLVSDGEDVSTPELVRRIAHAMGTRANVWPLPLWILRGLGRFTGKTAEIDRLTESLQVDGSAMREQLGWIPPYSMAQGLEATVAWYREQGR